MKLWKKILSALMALTFVISTCTISVMAEGDVVSYPEYGTKAYERMMLLEALGFIDEDDKLDLGRSVTRAEFAKWLSLIINNKDIPVLTTVKFTDVNAETLFANEIKKAVSAGYMTGTQEGKFEPMAVVTKQDAVAALVRLTGRDAFAIAKGGYPTGYFSVANSLHIMDSVAGDANAYNLLTMCYNTLRANMLVFNGANGNVETYNTNETVMGYFHNIYEVEGVVTANSYTRLYTEDVISSSNSLEINEVVYATKFDADYNDLIGMTVRGFYHYNEEDDVKTIVSIYANNDDNKVVEFEKDDLIPSDLSSDHLLKYTDENYRTKTVKLSRGFEYIYNGRVDADRGANDLFTTDRIKLIDRDTDGYYDTVIAEKCETMQFKSVDLFKEEVYTDKAVLKKADAHGSYLSFMLYNIDDETMTEVFPEQLDGGMVLSVYRSLDGMYVKAYATDNMAMGTVKGYDSDTNRIMIGEDWYDLAETLTVSQFELGTDASVLLDVYGRLAYIDTVGGEYDFKYAYFFSAREDTEAEAVVVKLVTKSGQKKFNLADKVIIDGIKSADTAALALDRGVIRYKINKDGNVRVIDTVATGNGSEVNDTLTESIPKQSVKIYPLSGIIAGSYMLTSNTFKLVIPSVPAEKDNIDLYATTFDVGTEPVAYDFACYDINDDDMSVGVCVYYPVGSLMGQVETNGGNNIGIVKDMKRNVWIDDEVRNQITFFTQDGDATYLTADSVEDSHLDALSFGDVVRFVTNTKGEVSTIFNELDVTRGVPTAVSHPAYNVVLAEHENGYYNYNFGRVLAKEKEYIVMQANKDNANFALNDIANRRIIYTPQIRQCWMVDMSEAKVQKASLADVAEYIAGAESPSYIYARTYKYYNLLHLIIYKY